MISGRVVIECRQASQRPGGQEYRVWVEQDGHRFGEQRSPDYLTAAAYLMQRLERGEDWVPEPFLSPMRGAEAS